jgi:hypothetical protein
VQELGRIHVQRRDPRVGKLGDGGVTGVVRAPHPRQDRCPISGKPCDGFEGAALRIQARSRVPDRVRLAGYGTDKWVRKVS